MHDWRIEHLLSHDDRTASCVIKRFEMAEKRAFWTQTCHKVLGEVGLARGFRREFSQLSEVIFN